MEDTPTDIIRPQSLQECAERFTAVTNGITKLLEDTVNSEIWKELDTLLARFHVPPLGLVQRQNLAQLTMDLHQEMECLLGHMAMHYINDDWHLHDHGGMAPGFASDLDELDA